MTERDESLHDGSRTFIPSAAPERGFREDAFKLIRERAAKIDRDRGDRGMPALVDADMTREQRANAIRFILSGPQDVESVASAAVQCIAFLETLMRAEDASPELGSAA